ncbi:MAG: cysteine dioxygenase family protein [Bacteroidia bacterium]
MSVELDRITELDELLETLRNAESNEIPFIASRIAIDAESLAQWASFSEVKYTRNKLIRTEEFELMILGWTPGQSTKIHAHDHQKCWVHIVEGEFVEHRYEYIDNKMVETSLDNPLPGKTTFMEDDMGYHKLQNVSDRNGMSLHLYYGPIDQCLVYNEETGEFELKKMTYDTEADLA